MNKARKIYINLIKTVGAATDFLLSLSKIIIKLADMKTIRSLAPTDIHAMLEYALTVESRLWNGFMRSFTTANVVSLLVWLGVTLHFHSFDIFVWLRIMALAFSVTYTGWWIDRIWYRWFSGKFAHAFSMKAYLTRLIASLMVSGSVASVLTVFLFAAARHHLPEYILFYGVVVTGYQLIYQWIMFNRIRKLSVAQL